MISVAQSEGTFVTYLRFDVGGLVSDLQLLSTVFIKTFTQIYLLIHTKTMDKISCVALGPVHCTQVWKNVY